MTDSQGSVPDGAAGWIGVPPPPAHNVLRRRLLDLLDAGEALPLSLVSAPAGSGKTSMVADWVTSRPDQRTAWITFESGDEAFWPGIVGCLELLHVSVSAHRFPNGPVALERRLLRSLAAATAAARERVTIVVDGYEVVSDVVARDLDFLIRHSGGQLRLILLTRVDPLLPLYRYRLEGTLAEVRMSDLAFNDGEAAELIAGCGIRLSPRSVHALNARAEGWVAGLRFAVPVLATGGDAERSVADVAGNHGDIGEFLMSEVLAAQPPDVRELLLRTSIPETLQPGLSEELGGRSATRKIGALTHQNAFVQEVTEHPGYYRYHPFFRDLLMAELDYESPETMLSLQRRTARWFAEHGSLTLAVTHCAAIGAWADAAQYLVDDLAIGQLILADPSSALTRTLRAMPEDVDDPPARVVRAALALSLGDGERFREELDGLRAPPGSGSGDGPLALATALLGAAGVSCLGDMDEADTLADLAETALARRENQSRAAEHPELRALVLAGKGVASARAGNLARAHELLLAGAQAAPEAGAEAIVTSCLGYASLISCLRGKLSRASSLATRAMGTTGDSTSADVVAAAQLALAWIALEQENLVSAAEQIARSESSALATSDPLLRTVLHLLRARLLSAQGAVDEALAEVAVEADGSLEPGSWLRDLTRVEAAHMRVLNGQPDEAMDELQGVQRQHGAEVELVVAQARLGRGEGATIGEALSQVLVEKAPVGVRVSALIVESSRQLSAGSPARARAALHKSLRLAEPERLRRPFKDAPSAVQLLLRRDASLSDGHRWLGTRTLRRPTDAVVPAQRTVDMLTTSTPPVIAPVETLTERELEVLVRLSEMLTTEEIAASMYISVNTVRTHVRNVLRKLGVSRRHAAVRRARELELLPA